MSSFYPPPHLPTPTSHPSTHTSTPPACTHPNPHTSNVNCSNTQTILTSSHYAVLVFSKHSTAQHTRHPHLHLHPYAPPATLLCRSCQGTARHSTHATHTNANTDTHTDCTHTHLQPLRCVDLVGSQHST